MTGDLERVFRDEYGRVVASLARRFGDLDVAEEAASEAVLAAVERWPSGGMPPNPGGWLTTTATRKALDRLRREGARERKHRDAALVAAGAPQEATGPVDDDRLRLIFTCCHPALAPEVRVALTLRLLGGLTVPEIARAFLVSEPAMGQRITRAKAKIRAAGIPFRVPGPSDLPGRVESVLAVVFLVFNEGYLPGDAAADAPVRVDLCDEAIRLGRLLRALLPDEPEAAGLLAMMLLTDARRASRFAGSELVPLAEQDRAGWDRARIVEGHALVRECLAVNRPGRYQLVAAINAVHTDAPTAAETDWSQVVALYDQLLAVEPTSVVTLNRAIAVAELDGPAVGLGLIDALPLTGYHAWHAARADFLRRLGRTVEARCEYDAAIAATGHAAEAAYLRRRREQLVG